MAWVTGADIRIGEIDRQYLTSLSEIANEMGKWYPKISFSSSIQSHSVSIASTWSEQKYCLLYSGGVDSTSSLLRNRDKELSLIMIRGTPELRLHEGEYWERVNGQLVPFIQRMGVEVHIVETNIIDIINLNALNKEFGSQLTVGWWENLAHGLILLSLCAPYTYTKEIGKLMIASTDTKESFKPWGSTPSTDERIRWGDLKVVHDSFDLSRQQKIQTILAPFIREQGGSMPLRVCTGRPAVRLASNSLNCGKCEKCLRTMLGLLSSGVDPAECSFNTSSFSLSKLKADLESGRLNLAHRVEVWKSITQNISQRRHELDSQYPGLKMFFTWLSSWNFRSRNRRNRRYLNAVAPPDSRRRKVIRALLGRDK